MNKTDHNRASCSSHLVGTGADQAMAHLAGL
jgi:hypothetical protein